MPNDGLIARLRHNRARALARGDMNLVREHDLMLQRYGAGPDGPVSDAAEARAEADVRPVRSPTARRDA